MSVGYSLLQEVQDLLDCGGGSSSYYGSGGAASTSATTMKNGRLQGTPLQLGAASPGTSNGDKGNSNRLPQHTTHDSRHHHCEQPTERVAESYVAPAHEAALWQLQQQQHRAWSTPTAAEAPHRRLPNDVVTESIAETLDPDHQAFAVIDALLTTARHNTDLTELDLVCRRVRQSEIERLSEALEHLHKYDAYVKKRCNVLYDAINAVNDQQAQLVTCLEAALQASIITAAAGDGGPSSPVLSDRGAADHVLQQQQQHSHIGRWGASGKRLSGADRGSVAEQDDQGSLPGSLRPSRLAGVISSSSSQSGRYGRPQQQSSSPPHPTVTPYRVVGGPLNRHTLEAVVSH